MSENGEMDELRKEVHEVSKVVAQQSVSIAKQSESIESSVRSTEKLADSLTKLVEDNIRRQEREYSQKSINTNIDGRLTKLEDFREKNLISRATESQSRNFLFKYWPHLFGIIVIGSILFTAYYQAIGRAIGK